MSHPPRVRAYSATATGHVRTRGARSAAKRGRHVPGGPVPAALPPKRVAIYTLADPTTGRVVWVGATMRPRVRWLAHMSEARIGGGSNDAKNAWVTGLLRRGLRPVMQIREVLHGGGGKGHPRERHWIAKLARKGEPLLNIAAPPGRDPAYARMLARRAA